MKLIKLLQSYWQRAREQARREADDMEEPYLEGAINRSVLVVRPAEPFKRWAAKIEEQTLAQIRASLSKEEQAYLKPDPAQDDLDQDHGAYLIPAQDSLQVDPKVLKAIYANIFERELYSCHTDPKRWPKPRTLALFGQWFEIELCTMVVDLCADDIQQHAPE